MVDGVEMPALQVIVLGSGGGPIESNTTAFLVRSTAAKWQKGSLLAVDAGVHLAAIVKLLETHNAPQSEGDDHASTVLIDSPFEGLELPHKSPLANAGFITRTLVDTYLITHPHLDHISGFVVNTASLSGSRPKRLAALPVTIDAFKNHIFNNVIWPNLSDENNGAGLVTYMRLVEGGSLAIGEGEGKGYVEVCEGLSVKPWSVSHGHCIESHNHRGSGMSPAPGSAFQLHVDASPRVGAVMSTPMKRSNSNTSQGGEFSRTESFPAMRACVCDSSAYFIRDVATGNEVLIFGDLEPDTISLSPRNRQVWNDAAPKIASGFLQGIFIECSYDDSRTEDTLFGHMAPRYLIEELLVLADEVRALKGAEAERDSKKRKRISNGSLGENPYRRPARSPLPTNSPLSPTSQSRVQTPFDELQMDGLQENKNERVNHIQSQSSGIPVRNRSQLPLIGMKVVIIHVKEKLDDAPHISETILKELKMYEEEAGLGCEFIISQPGQSYYF